MHVFVCDWLSSYSVDLERLKCPVVNVSEPVTTPTGQEVCGSDNQTYSSLCNLLQTSRDVDVVHAGACEDEKCRTGPVSEY